MRGMGRHVTSTRPGSVPSSIRDDDDDGDGDDVDDDDDVGVALPVPVPVPDDNDDDEDESVAVAVRVYTPGGREGSRQDHSYPLTYTPVEEGMVVAVG